MVTAFVVCVVALMIGDIGCEAFAERADLPVNSNEEVVASAAAEDDGGRVAVGVANIDLFEAVGTEVGRAEAGEAKADGFDAGGAEA